MRKLALVSLSLSMILSCSSQFYSSYANEIDLNGNAINKIVQKSDYKSRIFDMRKGFFEDNLNQEDPNKEVYVFIETDQPSLLDDFINTKNKTRKRRSLNNNSSRGFYLDKAKENLINRETEALISNIKSENIRINDITKYNTVFSGISAKVSVKDIEKIKQIDGVRKVRRELYYSRPTMNSSTKQIKLDNTWNQRHLKGEGSLIAIIDTGIDPYHKDFVISDNSKVALTSEKVKEIMGDKGTYINEKVPFAYNYADKNNNPKDSSDQQHGMHVAGTVSANGDVNNGGIKGVAPESQILGMKVFSNDMNFSGVFEHVYVEAIEDSIKLGADAVNLSLGSTSGFYSYDEKSMIEEAFEKAKASGVSCLVAAGNDRNLERGTNLKALKINPDTALLGNPANEKNSFAVASLENTMFNTTQLDITIDGYKTKALASLPEKIPTKFENLEVVYAKKGVIDATKNRDDFDGLNLSGKVALIERGEITFVDKILNAQSKGAKGVVIYNNVPDLTPFGMMITGAEDKIKISAISIIQSEGVKIKEAVENSKSVLLTYNNEKTFAKNPNAGEMSDFSSWGPTTDLTMKPEITAPGGNIYSTQNNNGYVNMSGTSMATPHMAGVAALMYQRFKSENFVEKSKYDYYTKLLLMNTAEPVKKNSEYYSVRNQGAGLVNVDAAIQTKAFVTATGTNDNIEDGKLEVKSVDDKFNGVFNITNRGERPITYTVKGIVLKEKIQDDRLQEISEVVSETNLGEVVVDPNSSKIFNTELSTNNIENNQFVEGYVVFEPKGEDGNITLRVPFLGFHGDWNAPRIFDKVDYRNNIMTEQVDSSQQIMPIDQFTRTGFDFVNDLGRRFWRTVEIDGKKAFAFNTNPLNLGNGKVVNGNITPSLVVLRNAQDINFEIRDINGQKLSTITKELRLKKANRLYINNKQAFTNLPNWAWDGKIKGKEAEDGMYVYHIDAKINQQNASRQDEDYHIYKDNIAPEIVSYNLDKDNKTFEIVVKDQGSGVFNGNIFSEKLKINIGTFKSITDEGENKKISFSIEDALLPQIENDNLYVWVEDYAYNVAEQQIQATLVNNNQGGTAPSPATEEQNVNEDSDKPLIYITAPRWYQMITSKDSGEVLVTGLIDGIKNVTSVKIYTVDENGKQIGEKVDATFRERSHQKIDSFEGLAFPFEGSISINENGIAYIKIEVTGENKAGETVSDEVLRSVWKDTIAPTLDVEIKERSLDSDKAVFDIRARDEMLYLEVRVNGELIDRKDRTYIKLVPDKNGITSIIENFEYPLEIGKNIITISVSDDAENVTEKVFEIDRVAKEDMPKEDLSNVDTPKEEILPVRNGGLRDIASTPENPVSSNSLIRDNKLNADIVKRISGNNRYETSVKISQQAFDKADTVIIASGENYPDALSAGTLATIRKAPILLVGKNKIDDSVIKEVERLKAKNIIIVGGTQSISNGVLEKFDNKYSVKRISGKNRFETSKQLYRELANNKNKEELIVASASDYPDALSVSAVAGSKKMPILLIANNNDEIYSDILKNYKKVYVIGGENSISDKKIEEIKRYVNSVERIGGADRYETSLNIWKRFNKNSENLVIASGMNFSDALTGVSLANNRNTSILLSSKNYLSEKTKKELSGNKYKNVEVLGGLNTIGSDILNLFN